MSQIEDFDGLLNYLVDVSKILDFTNQTYIIFNKESLQSIVAGTFIYSVLSNLKNQVVLIHNSNQLKVLQEFDNFNIIYLETYDFMVNNSNTIYIGFDTPKIDSTRAHIINPADFGYPENRCSLSLIIYFLFQNQIQINNNILKIPLLSSFLIYDFVYTSKRITGLFDYVLNKVVTGDLVKEDMQMIFQGKQIFTISEAIYYSLYPFLPSVSGNMKNVKDILTQLDIVEEINGISRKFFELQKSEISDLYSHILILLAKNNTPGSVPLLSKSLVISQQTENPFDYDLRDLAMFVVELFHSKNMTLLIDLLLNDLQSISQVRSQIIKSRRILMDKIKNLYNLSDEEKFAPILILDKLDNFWHFFILCEVVFQDRIAFPNDFQFIISQLTEDTIVKVQDRSEDSDNSELISEIQELFLESKLINTDMKNQYYLLIKKQKITHLYEILNSKL